MPIIFKEASAEWALENPTEAEKKALTRRALDSLVSDFAESLKQRIINDALNEVAELYEKFIDFKKGEAKKDVGITIFHKKVEI